MLMDRTDKDLLQKANDEAVFCLYSYIADKGDLSEYGVPFSLTVRKKRENAKRAPQLWSRSDLRRLEVIEAALKEFPHLSEYTVGDTVFSDRLNAAVFLSPEGKVSVVFRGTGKDEWLDNGIGLSGIPEENVYYTYKSGGRIASSTVKEYDFATDRQAEALNWFNYITAKNGWDMNTSITVSGHSKGGNKAQFIAIMSDLAELCISFDGQGFSPEAIEFFRSQNSFVFEMRRKKIFSLCADCDYINVLGDSLAIGENIFYFKAPLGDKNVIAYHFMESLLDGNGKFNEQTEKGEISRYIVEVWRELSLLPPYIRKFATLGITNEIQKLTGGTLSDMISPSNTAKGIGIVLVPLLSNLIGTKNGR